MAAGLEGRVAALPRETLGDSFTAARVADGSDVRIARRGRALALLIPVQEDARVEPDLRLANLSVTNRARCRVFDGEREYVGDFGIVECTSEEPTVQATFVEVLGWLLPPGGPGSVDQVRMLVSSLVRLFTASQDPPRTSVVGLWGELWIMARAEDPVVLAQAWHAQPGDRWDFGVPGVRLEVKTTTGPRRHHFSLEQLTPPAGARVYVASIVTAELPTGMSLTDLLANLVRAIDSAELRTRVISTAMGSLGAGWASARRSAYDDALAEATLRVLASDAIPRVAAPPPEVSGISFQVDVEDVDDVSSRSVVEQWLERAIWGPA